MYNKYIPKDRKPGGGRSEDKVVGPNNTRQLTRTLIKELHYENSYHSCIYSYEVSMITHCYLGTGVMGCTVLHKDMTEWPRLCLRL